MKLFIKYMVGMPRKMAVIEELNKLGLHFRIVEIGIVEIMENITAKQREQIRIALLKSGLELIEDKKAIAIEKIRNIIIERVHYTDELSIHTDELSKINFSDYMIENLNYDYIYLANLFSEVQGISIEKFIISHKIERTKELIIYDELNLSEIAWKMKYSSVAHLSNQFKMTLGLTPAHFKKLKDKRRKLIEETGNLPDGS